MNKFYFLLGFFTAVIITAFTISCASPLQANGCEPGSEEWCPLYVKVVE